MPWARPGQVNARNYASDYYVVISPSGSLKMQQIRHTYLHYLLDPLALKNGASLQAPGAACSKKLKSSPMDDAFKNNISLLVTECLVRAIELRTAEFEQDAGGGASQDLDQSDQEGYVLTRYFYEALVKFEKDPAGLRAMYARNAGRDRHRQGNEAYRADPVRGRSGTGTFAPGADRGTNGLLLNAERRFSAGDIDTAQKLAQQALDENQEDPGRASVHSGADRDPEQGHGGSADLL